MRKKTTTLFWDFALCSHVEMDGRSEVLTACNIKAGLDSNGSIQGQQQALLITVMNIRTHTRWGIS
jgi:hypothetical protein